MRRKTRTAYLCLTLCLSALTSAAQLPGKTSDAVGGSPAATGSVTGRVYLEDTKAPARKATVSLQPVTTLVNNSSSDQHDQRHTQATGPVTIGLETRFDGSFSFAHVPFGTYYVIASSPGYVSSYLALAVAEARSTSNQQQPLGGAQVAAQAVVLKTIPRVTVASGLPTTIDVSLERGGAVSGTITYDDGGPAAGLQVNVLAGMVNSDKENWTALDSYNGVSLERVTTDDRGNYRVSGLPASKYVVQVMLNLSSTISYRSSGSSTMSTQGNRSDSLEIYSGSTPRLKDATSFAIDLGEEHTGEDIRIPLSKLHTITGNVVSAHDGHVINGGQVMLLRAEDHSMVSAANSSPEDPRFILNFVYEGEYILNSPVSSDIDLQPVPQTPGFLSPPQYSGTPRHFYGAASKPLHVTGDMDGVILPVPEPTAKEAQVMKQMLQQQESQSQPAK